MSDAIASHARYADIVSVRTLIALDQTEAPVVRKIGDVWKRLARGRRYPSWDDFDTDAFGTALKNLLVLRVVGDCEDYEFCIAGNAHIKALGLDQAPARLSELDAVVPGYAATLKPLYDRAVRSRQAYALRSELVRPREATAFFSTESAFLPMGPSDACVDHILVASLYRSLRARVPTADAPPDFDAVAPANCNDEDLMVALRGAARAIANRMAEADGVKDPIDRILVLLEAGMPLDAERRATCHILHRLPGESVDDALRAEFALFYEAWREAVWAAVIDAQAHDHFGVHDARALAEALVALAEGLGTQGITDPARMPPARLRTRLAHTVGHLAEGSPFGAAR